MRGARDTPVAHSMDEWTRRHLPALQFFARTSRPIKESNCKALRPVRHGRSLVDPPVGRHLRVGIKWAAPIPVKRQPGDMDANANHLEVEF